MQHRGGRRCIVDLIGTHRRVRTLPVPDPERDAIENENELVARRVLNSIGKRDREVLIRFYLDEQSPDIICRDMGLTETTWVSAASDAWASAAGIAMARSSGQSNGAAKSGRGR